MKLHRPTIQEIIMWHEDISAHYRQRIRETTLNLAECVDAEEFSFWFERREWYRTELEREEEKYDNWLFSYQ